MALGRGGQGAPHLGSCWPASTTAQYSTFFVQLPCPSGPVKSKAGCGYRERCRWNDLETEKLTPSVSFHFKFMRKENGKVFKHKGIFYSNSLKKKNASPTVSSLGHQIALLTAFLIKKPKKKDKWNLQRALRGGNEDMRRAGEASVGTFVCSGSSQSCHWVSSSESMGVTTWVASGFLGSCAVTRRIPAVQTDPSRLGPTKSRDRLQKTEGDRDQKGGLDNSMYHPDACTATDSHTSSGFSIRT